jgi:CheY-like chemotaxis protein
MKSKLTESAGGNGLTHGAHYANTLFNRHHVAPRAERTRLVAGVLGLEYRAAHRRVRGEIPWTFEELAQLAAHFGESLQQVFSAAEGVGIKARADEFAPAGLGESGTLVAGGLRLNCQFDLGAQVTPTPHALVAHRQAGGWVVAVGTASDMAPCFAVTRIWLDPQLPTCPKVAVLDDDRDFTDSVCAYLRQAGYVAEPFHTVAELSTAAAAEHHDAYLLDWLVGADNVAQLIASLRASPARSVIAVLTGQAESGPTVTADIAEALATHDVEFFQKPMPLAILTSKLMRLLEAAKTL